MRNPTREIEATLKDSTTVRIEIYGVFVPSEPGFSSEIIGFEFRVFGERGELFEKDIPIEWGFLEGAAMDALCEPIEGNIERKSA